MSEILISKLAPTLYTMPLTGYRLIWLQGLSYSVVLVVPECGSTVTVLEGEICDVFHLDA